MAKKEYIVDWTVGQEIISIKGKNTLVVNGIEPDLLSFSINHDGYLSLKNESTSEELLFSNYSSLKYLKSDTIPSKINLIENSYIDNTQNPYDAYSVKKGKLTTTNYNDKINIIANSIENKTLTISTKYGDDDIKLLMSEKSLKLNSGNGNNTVDVKVANNATIKSGSGNDNIILKSKGSVSIAAGAGNNLVTVDNEGSTSVKCGSGDDEISLNNSAKAVTVKAGNGSNIVNIADTTGKNTVTTGSGKDVINITTTGAVSINSGKSDDEITVDTANSLTIKSSSGDNNIVVNNSSAKKSTIETGSGNDEISVSGSSSAKINAGAGSNNIEISGSGENTVKTGKGDDIIAISGGAYSDIYAGAGINTINIDNTKSFGQVKVFEQSVSALNKVVFQDNLNLFYEISREKNDLIIKNNSNNSKLVLSNYYKTTKKSAEYEFYVKDKQYTLDELITMQGTLSRGAQQYEITVPEGADTVIYLSDTFSGNDYKYTLKSLSGDQTVKVEYLVNGRFVVQGNYLEIDADNGQADDIILLGSRNVVNTSDEDDTVRLGYVMDGNGYYEKQSNFNTVNLGEGNDYNTFLGAYNVISTDKNETDIDYVADMVRNSIVDGHSSVDNVSAYSDYVRYIHGNFDSTSIDNKVGWFAQGGGGGDCRLLSLLHSLSKTNNFDLSDYVEIEQQTSNSWEVTFKKYSGFAGSGNTYTVTSADLENAEYVFGDLDVVIADLALNKLIYTNKTADALNLTTIYGEAVNECGTVQSAYYNTLSNYIFGKTDTTFIEYNTAKEFAPDFNTLLSGLWGEYKSGEISNLSIGIKDVPHNLKLGILSGHAYSLLDYNEDYVTLMNPWDSADCLRLDTETFNSLKPCIIIYGEDRFDQNLLIQQGLTAGSDFTITDSGIDLINYYSVAWTSVNSGDVTYNMYPDDVNKELQIVQPADMTNDINNIY